MLRQQLRHKEKVMNRKRILIVEDDDSVLQILITGVEMCCPDFEVEVASNGQVALARLQDLEAEQSVDLILTDYNMPLMNGLELARAVRNRWPGVPIVMMTGTPTGDAFQREVDALNLDGYILKPFGMDQLEELLHGY